MIDYLKKNSNTFQMYYRLLFTLRSIQNTNSKLFSNYSEAFSISEAEDLCGVYEQFVEVTVNIQFTTFTSAKFPSNRIVNAYHAQTLSPIYFKTILDVLKPNFEIQQRIYDWFSKRFDHSLKNSYELIRLTITILDELIHKEVVRIFNLYQYNKNTYTNFYWNCVGLPRDTF